MPRPRLVGSTQAAAAVGVDPSTLWRWHHSGVVRAPIVTPGGHLRWDLDALQAFLATTPNPEDALMTDPHAPTNPPVATAIVVSERGVLIGQRNDGRPPWTFIAGKAHDQEPIAAAAVREVKEETGLVVVAGDGLIGRRLHPRTGWDMHYVPCHPADSRELDVIVGDEEELAQVVWEPSLAGLETRMGVGMIFEPVRDYLAVRLNP